MKIIILTKEPDQGKLLKDSLTNLNENFSSLKNYTKKDIINNPSQFVNTSFIFSTWFMPSFKKEEIRELFPNLKAVFYAAGSTEYFAKQFINQNVKIYSASKANAIPVAEFVLAQILLSNKGYFQAVREYRKPFWKFSFQSARKYSIEKKGNFNAKIGIIGCGEIGSKVVRLLKNHELDVYVCDPFIAFIFY